MSRQTPIAFFAYNRPAHTRLALNSLGACDRLDECKIYIHSDGPRIDEHNAAVTQVRTIIHTWGAEHNAQIIEQNKNLGLARSIVSGVSRLCEEYGRVIVIEDDLILHPGFIDYMLSALDRYEDEDRVAQVSGFMYPVKHDKKPDAFFLPVTTTWGWGTWNRSWKDVDWQATAALDMLKDFAVRQRFDLDGTYPYTAMLQDRIHGKNQSWGVLFYWWAFSQQKLTLHPRQSLVMNKGFDGSGYHSSVPTVGYGVLFDESSQWNKIIDWQIDLKIHDLAYEKIKIYLKKLSPSIFRRIASRVKISLKKLAQTTINKPV